MTEDKSIINATPTKELFISMLIRDVTLRDAIGDLLDNCIDGALKLRPKGNYKGLKVEIELDTVNGYFKINDNCGGIPVDVARDHAFRFGRSQLRTETTKHSVGVFGIGMKRALFKLGKNFHVESVSDNSSFEMSVDVNTWKDLKVNDMESWQFTFDAYKEGLKKEFPESERGTKITVTSLNDDVLESFKTDQDMDDLIKELEREHLYSIDKGLKITINRRILKAPELSLLASKEIQPSIWESHTSKVKVRIVVGVSEQEKYGPSGGWYVFGNKRLILGPDHTERTGWGAKKPIRIPEYHPQFYRFRGFVFLDAEDPRDLPWNTSKTNMDLDSPVYRTVLQQMIVMMRNVIDFLNKLHDEKNHYEKGLINSTPLQKSIDKAEHYELNTVISTKKYFSNEVFVFPEPAERVTSSKPKSIWVRFEITSKESEAIKEYFDNDNLGEIGRAIFDYFYEREVDSK